VVSATGSSSGGKRRRSSRILCNGRRRRRTEDLALQVGAIAGTVREQFISQRSNQVNRTLAFDVSQSPVAEIVQTPIVRLRLQALRIMIGIVWIGIVKMIGR
jgi:hypothetical protein